MMIDGKEQGRIRDDYFTAKRKPIDQRAEPQDGDLRIVVETKTFPQRFRVDWYGTLVRGGRFALPGDSPVTCWRVAEAYGDKGYFPTLELVIEALEGPKVVGYYARD